jgi:hypothetical protein
MLKKGISFWVISMIVSLYTTFVLQQLWNWFAVSAFHASGISFWGMYGLVLLVGLLTERHEEVIDEPRWKTLFTILDIWCPEDKRQAVEEAMKEQGKSIWLDSGILIFGKVVENTLTLVLGWGIHAFFA